MRQQVEWGDSASCVGPRAWRATATHRTCGKQVRPCHAHPVFNEGWGQSQLHVSLANKAKMLFCMLIGLTTAQTRILLGMNHKAIESMSVNLDQARRRYVEKKEKDIQFGDDTEWVDVEADETVFRASLTNEKKSKEWEQWAGCVERGRPHTLVLWRTSSDITVARAPGPGAIKKSDWKPFLLGRLQNRRVILHSDGARSYKMRAPGVLHDTIVHARKRVKLGGKWVWTRPQFSKVVSHKLPTGGAIKVKAGTQIIDRAWQLLKGASVGFATKSAFWYN